MTNEEMANMIGDFQLVIDRYTMKHRKLHSKYPPTGAEYAEGWTRAVIASNPHFFNPKKPGRPFKTAPRTSELMIETRKVAS